MKRITIHTDGGCEGNPGPGGWAAVLDYEGRIKEVAGGEPATTNNRMELQAAIGALRALKEPCAVEFFTDSDYLRSGITKWIANWKARGWLTAGRQPVKNVDLWQALDEAARGHRIEWRWVKGHSGQVGNERCDRLAAAEIQKIRQRLTRDELRAAIEAFNATRGPAASQPALFE